MHLVTETFSFTNDEKTTASAVQDVYMTLPNINTTTLVRSTRMAFTKLPDTQAFLDAMQAQYVEFNITPSDQPQMPMTKSCLGETCPTEEDFCEIDPRCPTSAAFTAYTEPDASVEAGPIVGIVIACFAILLLALFFLHQKAMKEQAERNQAAFARRIAETIKLEGPDRELTPEALAEEFKKIDNGTIDGSIDKEELWNFVNSGNVSKMNQNDFNALFAALDTDGDGTVSFMEFSAYMGKCYDDFDSLKKSASVKEARGARMDNYYSGVSKRILTVPLDAVSEAEEEKQEEAVCFGVNDGSVKCVFVYRHVKVNTPSSSFDVLCVVKVSPNFPLDGKFSFTNEEKTKGSAVQDIYMTPPNTTDATLVASSRMTFTKLPNAQAFLDAIQAQYVEFNIHPGDQPQMPMTKSCFAETCPTEEEFCEIDPRCPTSAAFTAYTEPEASVKAGPIVGIVVACFAVLLLALFFLHKKAMKEQAERNQAVFARRIAETIKLEGPDRELTPEALAEEFKKIDNGTIDGSIDKEELWNFVNSGSVSKMNQNDFNALFAALDTDGDGTVSFMEFSAYMGKCYDDFDSLKKSASVKEARGARMDNYYSGVSKRILTVPLDAVSEA
eukprot:CAMPEP_0196225016 /NCGR_PEP_ID=MMETSP0912-20130531/49662_1 /TAXON_ID=49265 /ORGANISM="Thalassiosira rotula, Strain GSO102" /LENGTH=612 /DNA_ID=CAMNT_0041504459 /DNA_START=1 /DNA_END=1837 /DNA_ORIENTATION=+